MAIFWFLLITIIVIIIVALFINLRQEVRARNKLITLILLSIASALLLASLSLFAFKDYGSPNSFAFLELFIVIVPIQLALIIPVTLVDYFIYYLIYRGYQSVNIIYRIIIPPVFNIIGGGIVLIITAGFMAKPALNSFIHRDVIVTIKNETFIPGAQGTSSIYKVVLNVKNPSQTEISNMGFNLVTFKNKDSKNYYELSSNGILGADSTDRVIPTGESEIVVDLTIFVNENYLECNDGSLDKPLYLFYSIGDTYKPLIVGNSINQKILETDCKPNP